MDMNVLDLGSGWNRWGAKWILTLLYTIIVHDVPINVVSRIGPRHT